MLSFLGGGNHWPVTDKLYKKNVISSTPCHERDSNSQINKVSPYVPESLTIFQIKTFSFYFHLLALLTCRTICVFIFIKILQILAHKRLTFSMFFFYKFFCCHLNKIVTPLNRSLLTMSYKNLFAIHHIKINVYLFFFIHVLWKETFNRDGQQCHQYQ
jgi:hypothetical protein